MAELIHGHQSCVPGQKQSQVIFHTQRYTHPINRMRQLVIFCNLTTLQFVCFILHVDRYCFSDFFAQFNSSSSVLDLVVRVGFNELAERNIQTSDYTFCDQL